MLILTRKPGESLYIGDEIEVTVVEIKGNQIRLGIKAPPDVKIFRQEIYEAIKKENQTAAQGLMSDASLEQLSGGWRGMAKSPSASQSAGSKRVSLGRQGASQRVGSQAAGQSSGRNVSKATSSVAGGEKD